MNDSDKQRAAGPDREGGEALDARLYPGSNHMYCQSPSPLGAMSYRGLLEEADDELRRVAQHRGLNSPAVVAAPLADVNAAAAAVAAAPDVRTLAAAEDELDRKVRVLVRFHQRGVGHGE